MLEGGVGGGGKFGVLHQNRVERCCWFLFKLIHNRKRLRGESEILVEDKDDLELTRRVMGYTFGVGVRKGTNTGGGEVPRVVADVLNVIFHPIREEIDGICMLQSNLVRSAAEVSLSRYEKNMIVHRYDPLLSR